ncbi:MAG: YicC family protein [Candidatus Riflebacteria bacterium]|nr:YicC family protein [Candidatus Riflebacteria bacterium]
MLKSLTGFGKSESVDEKGRIFVELKSVNNRFLQIDLRTSGSYSWLENYIRPVVSEKITRGKVHIVVDIADNEPSSGFSIDRQIIGRLIDVAAEIEKEKGIKLPVSLDGILSIPGVIRNSSESIDEEASWQRIRPVVESAVESLVQSRSREGGNLAEDLHKRRDRLVYLVDSIEKQFPVFHDTFKRKFSAKIRDLLQETPLDETRMATEIALFTDKSDISEEITRLKSHLNELDLVLCRSDSIGRRLDFLIQEINREANTINSKASDLSIINDVMEIKCELEKIREQAQNIE